MRNWTIREKAVVLRSIIFAVMVAILCGFVTDASAKSHRISKAVWNTGKHRVAIEGRNWGRSQPVIVSNASNGEFLASVTSSRSGTWKLKLQDPVTVPCRVRAESGAKLAEGDVKNAPAACTADTFTHVFAFNDLGMHCMDKDFSVFSVLPPFNVVHAQVVRKGVAGSRPQILDNTQASVFYSAVADGAGSINTSSISKTNFWDFVLPLFGASLPLDTGFLGFKMPGASNTPQSFSEFDPALRWFAAEGIPITPLDDSHAINSYPLMRIQAFDIASASAPPPTFVVVPVSDEMHCSACHATGGVAANSATMQKFGIQNWSSSTEPEIQYRENILILHGAVLNIDFVAQKPVLCFRCHYQPPLDLAGTGPTGDQIGKPLLSAAMHGRHGKTLNGGIPGPSDPAVIPDTGISACYFCHPGTVTKCLRGAMGDAGIICQQCHGGLLALSGEFKPRTPWVDLPKCQSCHTGDAVDHLGSAIRGTLAYDPADPAATPIIATNKRFAEENGKLFRFSFGHNGIACESCHGSPHAEWPVSSTINDNIAAIQLQGHTGPIIECTACHADGPPLSLNGPHGLHNINDPGWNENHEEFFEHNQQACQACHGLQLEGTVLSRAAADRVLVTHEDSLSSSKLSSAHEGRSISITKGTQISCTLCHENPLNGEGGGER
ncbi:MAG: cytochrome C [Nitrospirota bacterium]